MLENSWFTLYIESLGRLVVDFGGHFRIDSEQQILKKSNEI